MKINTHSSGIKIEVSKTGAQFTKRYNKFYLKMIVTFL